MQDVERRRTHRGDGHQREFGEHCLCSLKQRRDFSLPVSSIVCLCHSHGSRNASNVTRRFHNICCCCGTFFAIFGMDFFVPNHGHRAYNYRFDEIQNNQMVLHECVIVSIDDRYAHFANYVEWNRKRFQWRIRYAAIVVVSIVIAMATAKRWYEWIICICVYMISRD